MTACTRLARLTSEAHLPAARPSATLAQGLAAGTTIDPLARQPGWWRRGPLALAKGRSTERDGSSYPPILIAGGTGTLGSTLARACEMRGLRAVALGRDQLDLASPDSVLHALDQWRPWLVVNTAGYARVDDAERHPRGLLGAEHDRCATAGGRSRGVPGAVCHHLDRFGFRWPTDSPVRGNGRHEPAERVWSQQTYG